MKITTYDELKAALQAWLVDTANVSKVTTDRDVLRFIAVQMADELNDMGRRETINLFVDGIPPISKERVEEWLTTAEECAHGTLGYDWTSKDEPSEEEVEAMRPNWDELFEDFYGPKVR